MVHASRTFRNWEYGNISNHTVQNQYKFFLQISNELSSLKAMDFYGTISSE